MFLWCFLVSTHLIHEYLKDSWEIGGDRERKNVQSACCAGWTSSSSPQTLSMHPWCSVTDTFFSQYHGNFWTWKLFSFLYVGLDKYLYQNLKAGRNFSFMYVIKYFRCLDEGLKDYGHLLNGQGYIQPVGYRKNTVQTSVQTRTVVLSLLWSMAHLLQHFHVLLSTQDTSASYVLLNYYS